MSKPEWDDTGELRLWANDAVSLNVGRATVDGRVTPPTQLHLVLWVEELAYMSFGACGSVERFTVSSVELNSWCVSPREDDG